jgi:hypothetical protein
MIWQPIDTAPSDGQDVLLFLKNGTIAQARRDFGGYGEAEFIENKWGYREAWSPSGVDGYDCIWLSDEPTHWMPLPEPPK